MSWLQAIYGKVRDHFIKIVSAIGMTLVSLDLSGYSDGVKETAEQYLGANIAHKVGIALFVLLFLRASFVTWSQRAPNK